MGHCPFLQIGHDSQIFDIKTVNKLMEIINTAIVKERCVEVYKIYWHTRTEGNEISKIPFTQFLRKRTGTILEMCHLLCSNIWWNETSTAHSIHCLRCLRESWKCDTIVSKGCWWKNKEKKNILTWIIIKLWFRCRKCHRESIGLFLIHSGLYIVLPLNKGYEEDTRGSRVCFRII